MPKIYIPGGSASIVNAPQHIVAVSTNAFSVGSSYPTPLYNTLYVDTVNNFVGINTGAGTADAHLSIAGAQADAVNLVDGYWQGTGDGGTSRLVFDINGHQTANAMDGGTIRMYNRTAQTIQINSDNIQTTWFGPNATQHALEIDWTAASSITGIKITTAASGGGVTISATGSATENLSLSGVGSGGQVRILGAGGLVIVTGGITTNTSAGALVLSNVNAYVQFASNVLVRSTGSGVLRLFDFAGTGYSAIDALGYRASGVSGVSGSWTTVDLKTITATNGIITSIV